jgi:CPA2 family monovalent cation:H+ antiporter-2
MAGELTLIVELVTVLGAATIGGYAANRAGQPVMLGYILAGTIVGPAGLKLIATEGDIQVLAEIGVALLLFVLGVEFSLKDLLRAIAFGGSTLQILLTILLGGGLTYLTGWVDSIPKAIFLGAVLSLSSTAVVLKSLIERNEVQTIHGQVMLAILIVQDLSLGLMLAVLPALAQPPETIGIALGFAALKILLFLVGAFIAGRWFIPLLIRSMARSSSQELFLLGILVLCLGIALLASSLGLGIAMGAFVAGLTVANVEYADRALDRILPMRDVFATLFFTSISLSIEPLFLWEHLRQLLGLVAISLIGKAAIATIVVSFFGYSLKTSLTVGTAALTLLIAPFILRAIPSWLAWLERWPSVDAILQSNRPSHLVDFGEELTGHIVVVGYGRVGQTLVRMIYFQGYRILAIDNNEAALQTLRERNIPYLFGDGSSQLVLEKANLARAKAMAITLPDPMATRLALNRALSIAPDLDITVRAHVDSEIDTLY